MVFSPKLSPNSLTFAASMNTIYKSMLVYPCHPELAEASGKNRSSTPFLKSLWWKHQSVFPPLYSTVTLSR